MKLEVGMYVRIKLENGYSCIGKIININEFREPSMRYCVDIQKNDYVFISKENIAKASFNPIDLIEVGDYVNGCKVHKIANCITIILDNEENISWVNPNDIKSIVTKEQFQKKEYRIGE